MSKLNNNAEIISSFRELLNYVCRLGEQINQIYDRLEKIELEIIEAEEELEANISDTRNELKKIKEILITKSELNEVIQKVRKTFEEFTPPKALV